MTTDLAGGRWATPATKSADTARRRASRPCRPGLTALSRALLRNGLADDMSSLTADMRSGC